MWVVPNLVKMGRNNLGYYDTDKTFSSLLWNDNYYLTCSHIKGSMVDDSEFGL